MRQKQPKRHYTCQAFTRGAHSPQCHRRFRADAGEHKALKRAGWVHNGNHRRDHWKCPACSAGRALGGLASSADFKSGSGAIEAWREDDGVFVRVGACIERLTFEDAERMRLLLCAARANRLQGGS